jgi:hypothetical protein
MIDVLAGTDSPVVPSLDHALSLQQSELLFELITQRFIGMGIGEKDARQGALRVR